MKTLAILLVILQGIAFAQQQPSAPPVPLWPGSVAVAVQKFKNQYVFLDPNGTELVVLLYQPDGTAPQIAKVPLHNQLRPRVSVNIQEWLNKYFYQYKVGNASTAREGIGSWAIVIPKELFEFTMTHPGGARDDFWVGGAAYLAVAKQSELSPDAPNGRYAEWRAESTTARIPPGSSLSGFEIQSNYLPGFTTGFISTGDLLNLPQDWPDDVFKQLDFLNDRSYRELPLLTVGPMFAEDTPVEQIAQNIKLGTQRWIATGKLDATSAFVQAVSKALSERTPVATVKITPHPKTQSEKILSDVVRISLKMSVEP